MQLLLDIIYFIGHFYIYLVLMRFILQISKADFYNPICQFVVKATNPLLVPLRKVIPGWKGLDFASLVLALFLEFILIALINMLSSSAFPYTMLIALALIQLIQALTQIYFWALIIVVIISWVAPGSYHPGAQLVNQVTEPLLKPIRQILPSTGGLDLSPMVLMLILFVVQKALTGGYF